MSTLVVLLLVNVVLCFDDVEVLSRWVVVGREGFGAGEGLAEEEEAEVRDEDEKETKGCPGAVAAEGARSVQQLSGREKGSRAYVRRTPWAKPVRVPLARK